MTKKEIKYIRILGAGAFHLDELVGIRISEKQAIMWEPATLSGKSVMYNLENVPSNMMEEITEESFVNEVGYCFACTLVKNSEDPEDTIKRISTSSCCFESMREKLKTFLKRNNWFPKHFDE